MRSPLSAEAADKLIGSIDGTEVEISIEDINNKANKDLSNVNVETARANLGAAAADLSNVDNTIFSEKLATVGAYGPKTIQFIETSQDWTVPDDVYEVMIYVLGGGGGGSGRYSDKPTKPPGGGGGYFDYQIIPVTPGDVYTITIGAGGSGGERTSNAETRTGQAGGTTSFGNRLSALGGEGGSGLTSNTSGALGGTIGVIGDVGNNGIVCAYTGVAYGASGGKYGTTPSVGANTYGCGGNGSSTSSSSAKGSSGTDGVCILVY